MEAGGEIHKRWGANLPHWTQQRATYAVTFRLADSLPEAVLERWVSEREQIVGRAEANGRPLAQHELSRLDELHSARIEAYLDAGHGACWLKDSRAATIVRDALLFFEGDRYQMLAWCVMPNHVHAVFTPMDGRALPAIVHSWKSFTAKEVNRIVGRVGPLWQPESYDHLVRDKADLAHATRYVLENPRKAGLVDWPWVGRGKTG
jgi:REP element-mobilizing transposase RayT